eukprot:scaffold209550_cov19-Tisochrysis_lutea.AAC.1
MASCSSDSSDLFGAILALMFACSQVWKTTSTALVAQAALASQESRTRSSPKKTPNMRAS